MTDLVKEPNNDLLNNILQNVDTSQSIINKKNNSNKNNPQLPNINTNSSKDEQLNKINNNNINLTKNLDDLIKEANFDINHIETTMDQSKTSDTEVNKILEGVDTSQTILNKKEKEIKNILKDVKTSNTDFPALDINNIDNKNISDFKSVEDIKKMFSDDNKPNVRISKSNLYGNNNISDTQINNIFKNEMITSDSFSRNSSCRENGPYKPEFNIPSHMQDYNYGYNNNVNNYNNINNKRRQYNIKPSHENKIRAITNLLEDLSIENLLFIKNQIINKLNCQK